MKSLKFLCTILGFIASSSLLAQTYTPELALNKLKDGNMRYANDLLLHPRQDLVRREATVLSQTPFAVIVGCSDSRVPPEIIFDQGVGDLFIVRDAGNVVGPVEKDSIDFGIHYLKASLIVVLGHENCGAVTAVVEGKTENIEAVAHLIQPAVYETRGEGPNRIEKAIKANVLHVVEELKRNPDFTSLLEQGKLKIVGGYYNLGSGIITWL